MEQSNLSSLVIAKYKIAYPYYFTKLEPFEFQELIKLYEPINKYPKSIVSKAVEKIILTSKFMPSLADLVSECDKQKKGNVFRILELMQKDGYFKSSWEYDKAIKFAEGNILPEWLKNDMKKYIPKSLDNTQDIKAISSDIAENKATDEEIQKLNERLKRSDKNEEK